jgi:hypothetical protein
VGSLASGSGLRGIVHGHRHLLAAPPRYVRHVPCRRDARILVLNLVLLAFMSLLPFPSDLISLDDRSPSAVIAFCAVGGAATPCEFALWRHLHRNRDLLLLPYVPEGLVVELRNWRFWSLGLFMVSFLSPRIAVVCRCWYIFRFTSSPTTVAGPGMVAPFIYFATGR